MSWIPLAIDMARQRHYSSPQLMGGRFIASSPHGENEIKEKRDTEMHINFNACTTRQPQL